MENFREISGSFLETVRVGTFLVFSRKFPKKCASGYVPPVNPISTGEGRLSPPITTGTPMFFKFRHHCAVPPIPLPFFNIKWPLTKIRNNLVENLKILIFKVIFQCWICIGPMFPKNGSIGNIRRPFTIRNFLENFDFLSTFLTMCPIFVGLCS